MEVLKIFIVDLGGYFMEKLLGGLSNILATFLIATGAYRIYLGNLIMGAALLIVGIGLAAKFKMKK